MSYHPTTTALHVSLASCLVFAAGCSSSEHAVTGPTDGSTPVDAMGDVPADATPHPPPLAQIPNNGGPVIASPEVVTVTWQGDTINAELEAFDDWMVPSAFWKTLMAEWGVGPGTHSKSWRIPTPAPAILDDVDVQQILTDAFAAGTLPPPNGSRIYNVYPPAGTTVTDEGSTGCGFQAYHSSFVASVGDAGATALAVYSMIPRCDGGKAYGMTPVDYVTWGASHEVMEAASDPDYMNPAWRIESQSLATPEPGENADLCTGQPTSVDGHEVTRNWSNVAAAKGDRPCVPAPPGPMFGAYGDPGEISLKPGSTTTTKVRIYATGPLPAINVSAYPYSKELTAKISPASGVDGDVLTLTVTASASFVAQPGSNLVALTAATTEYSTRRVLIVK